MGGAAGLVQAGLLVVVLVVLAILVQMDGGVGRELAKLKLPSLPKPAASAQAAQATPTGFGIAGAAAKLSNATTNSMNQSAQRLEQAR
jgi:hypothetical protein